MSRSVHGRGYATVKFEFNDLDVAVQFYKFLKEENMRNSLEDVELTSGRYYGDAPYTVSMDMSVHVMHTEE